MNRFSNKTYLQEMAARLRPELTFPIDQPDQWSTWRAALRSQVAQLLGGIPPQLNAPQVEVLDSGEFDGFRRDKLAIRSRDDVEIPAYLLTPHGDPPPGGRPAVLCLHGHGRGKDDIVGEPGDGTPQEQAENAVHVADHNYDYARQYARRGYVTLAPDARGFGEWAEGSEDGCHIPGVVSLMLGIPIVGQRLRDDLSALDYLCSVPGVDAARIGCVGLSEGGKRTLYLAALDDRIKSAVISGYFSSLRGFIAEWQMLGNHDICNYVPGLLRYADYTDLATLIAPRPLLIENGAEDPIFDQSTVMETVEMTARAFAAYGAPDHFDVDTFSGGHMWSGKKSLPWMDRWL